MYGFGCHYSARHCFESNYQTAPLSGEHHTPCNLSINISNDAQTFGRWQDTTTHQTRIQFIITHERAFVVSSGLDARFVNRHSRIYCDRDQNRYGTRNDAPSTPQ